MDSMKLPASMGSDLLPHQLSGFRGPPAGHYTVRELFVYQVPLIDDLGTLTGTETQNLLIQNDSDFEWSHGVYHFVQAAAQTTFNTGIIPNMTIQIADSSSGRFISDAAVPITTLFGTPLFPRFLPITKVFLRNSLIQFTAANFDATTANGDLRLSLVGWKLYYYPLSGGMSMPGGQVLPNA